jgi:hypothetical protein
MLVEKHVRALFDQTVVEKRAFFNQTVAELGLACLSNGNGSRLLT